MSFQGIRASILLGSCHNDFLGSCSHRFVLGSYTALPSNLMGHISQWERVHSSSIFEKYMGNRGSDDCATWSYSCSRHRPLSCQTIRPPFDSEFLCFGDKVHQPTALSTLGIALQQILTDNIIKLLSSGFPGQGLLS